MIELYFIYNGHRKILIGSFGHIHSAINELKKHQASYSAINHPRFRKSMSGENIRIDYGAADCYYLITKKTEENKMNTKMNLEEKVQQWFVDRNLHEANPVKQFLKLMEESGELFEGIAKDKSELIYDALGDIQVVLIGLEQQIKNGAQIQANQQELELLLMVSSLGNISQKLYAHICHNETQIPLIKADLMFLDSVVSTVSFWNGTTAESCLEEAYEVIKDRKGKMIDGVFVKEEDLPDDTEI